MSAGLAMLTVQPPAAAGSPLRTATPRGALLTVGIGGWAVTAQQDATLVTYALGSCVGVMLHCPYHKVAGMLHYMLPLSQTSPERAASQPGMFADTGVPLLFQNMYRYGCRKEELVVKLAGGARFIDDSDVFDIGQRNLDVLEKIFARAGVRVSAQDVGGNRSRTCRLAVSSGQLVIQSQGVESNL